MIFYISKALEEFLGDFLQRFSKFGYFCILSIAILLFLDYLWGAFWNILKKFEILGTF